VAEKIVKVVNVTDAIDEKIKVVEEELKKAKAEYYLLSGKTWKQKINRFFFITLLFFLCTLVLVIIAVITGVSTSSTKVFVSSVWLILAMTGILSGILAAFTGQSNDDNKILVTEAKNHFETLTAMLESLKLERRKMLLEQGNEITAISTENNSKECPRCAEIVKLRAKVCRFCNYEFEDGSATE